MVGDGAAFTDVDRLSESGSSHEPDGAKPQCERQRLNQRSKQKRVLPDQSGVDETGLRAMLGKPKCGCKRRCLSQFTDDTIFTQLVSFRSEWGALHKLDQDTEDARFCCVCFSFSMTFAHCDIVYFAGKVKTHFPWLQACQSMNPPTKSTFPFCIALPMLICGMFSAVRSLTVVLGFRSKRLCIGSAKQLIGLGTLQELNGNFLVETFASRRGRSFTVWVTRLCC